MKILEFLINSARTIPWDQYNLEVTGKMEKYAGPSFSQEVWASNFEGKGEVLAFM